MDDFLDVLIALPTAWKSFLKFFEIWSVKKGKNSRFQRTI